MLVLSTPPDGGDGPTLFRSERSVYNWRLGWRVVSANWLATFSSSPPGFGLPVVWQRFRRLASTLVAGFGVAFGIELSQVVISLIVGVPYRAFDVDDLMLNTAGAIIGWVAWRISAGSHALTNPQKVGNRMEQHGIPDPDRQIPSDIPHVTETAPDRHVLLGTRPCL